MHQVSKDVFWTIASIDPPQDFVFNINSGVLYGWYNYKTGRTWWDSIKFLGSVKVKVWEKQPMSTTMSNAPWFNAFAEIIGPDAMIVEGYK